MSPEKQRIAIATACGWTAEQDSNGYWRATNQNSGHASELWLSERNVWSVGIPDYLGDLNACHEMEKTLRPITAARYHQLIQTRLKSCDLAIGATSSLRCEAFLRTLGLWEKEQ